MKTPIPAFLLQLLICLVAGLWSEFAQAQACSGIPEGTMVINGTGMRYCRSGSWENLPNSNTVTQACTAGAIEYFPAANMLRYCSGGTHWRNVTTSGTNLNTCTEGGRFYMGGDKYYYFCNGSRWRRIPAAGT